MLRRGPRRRVLGSKPDAHGRQIRIGVESRFSDRGGSGKIEIGMRRHGCGDLRLLARLDAGRAGDGCLPTDGMLRPLKTRLPGNRDDGRSRRPAPPQKKLYIETVGCQMNLLDSELVVAKLRNEGYELTDDINQADAILYNTCSVRQHAEDKIYSALGRIKRLKERKPEVTIGVLGCMAQKDQEAIFRRAPHVDIVVGPGQLARVPELLAKARDRGRPQIAVSRARNDGSLEVDRGELRELRRRPRAGDAAQPVPGVRPGHDGLRQVLHLLHRALGPRARAKPPARGDPGRGPAARRSGRQGNHPPGPDRQQLQVSASPTGGPAGSPTCSARIHEIDGIERIKFITNFPNDMTDDLLQAVRDLPKVCRYLHVPAQSGCDDDPQADEADVHGRPLRGDAGPGPRDDSGRGGLERLHRRLLRRERGVVRADGRAGGAVSVQEQLHLQVQRAAGDEGRPTVSRRRARGGQEAAEQRVAGASDGDQPGGQPALGRADRRGAGRRAESQDGSAGRLGWGRPVDGRTACDRIAVFDGAERLIGRFVRVVVEDASAVTLFGRVETTERVATSA